MATMTTKQIGARFSITQLEQMDKLIIKGKAKTRSDVVYQAVVAYLNTIENINT